MWTVHEVSALTGASIRALRHYDKLGLLRPTMLSDAGYRLYDEESLVRLQCIMFYKTVEFPLKEIRAILDSPSFDRNRALDQQIALLELKRERLDNLILLAKSMRAFGIDMDHIQFEPFDSTKIEQYVAEARANWNNTDAWREYERKAARRTPSQEKLVGQGLMALMAEFGRLKDRPAEGPEAQSQVEKLRSYITEHYYPCTDAILHSLGTMYAGGGAMTENIDAAGGPGTGEFIRRAIEAALHPL